jgi:hypothetical protein
LRWYERILATRRDRITPLIPGITRAGTVRIIATNAVFVIWRTGEGRQLHLCANLSDEPCEFPAGNDEVIWHENGDIPRFLANGDAAGTTLPPWTVRWAVREP